MTEARYTQDERGEIVWHNPIDQVLWASFKRAIAKDPTLVDRLLAGEIPPAGEQAEEEREAGPGGNPEPGPSSEEAER